ncbi:MAG: alpha/beta hydrolase, partial [Pseudomonadota bacterium]
MTMLKEPTATSQPVKVSVFAWVEGMIQRGIIASLVSLISVLCVACVSPAARIDAEAARYGFQRQIVQGADFPHLVYRHQGDATTGRLHVYIEGDGVPWLTRRIVSADPTPRYALVLRLMAQDTMPALYLGRPCYFGFARTSPCERWFWTHGRFAPAVVDSMAAALTRLLEGQGSRELVLIGHSGGGALAVLLAGRLSGVRAVVTLAGNLDTDAWIRHHGYSHLAGSLNPAASPTLARRIEQLHYQGGRDREIPPVLIGRFAARQPFA